MHTMSFCPITKKSPFVTFDPGEGAVGENRTVQDEITKFFCFVL